MSTSPPLRRRFLPIPVETTFKTHKKLPIVDSIIVGPESQNVDTSVVSSNPAIVAQLENSPKRRILPQPVETTRITNHGGAVKSEPTSKKTTISPPLQDVRPSSLESQARTRPRFAPQLIETSRRSKKSDDARPATLPTDKTDITPGTNHIYLPSRRSKFKSDPHLLSPHDMRSSSLPPLRPYRQGSMRPHPNTRQSTRYNSYHPGIDTIFSDNSYSTEEDVDSSEETPSLSDSFGSSEVSNTRLQMARSRSSCDENYTGYLLSQAAVQAEKQLQERQLQEQELAAYANSDFHNPVEHFCDLESDTGSADDVPIGLLPHEMVVRKQSTVAGFMAAELQLHEETLAVMRAEETFRRVAEEASMPSFPDPFWTNGMNRIMAAPANDDEVKAMRDAASPPMLGDDLVFRMCPSPQPTKFETGQRLEAPPPKDDCGGGLWGGYCVAEDDCQYIAPHHQGPILLATPDNERDDPFASYDVSTSAKPHPTSIRGLHMLAGIDERLKAEAIKVKLEEAIRVEFNDTFVTQVYNYLSLGYPLLAQEYDEELSHISHIPEEELRNDGKKGGAVGNVGIRPGTGVTDANGAKGVGTPRWNALKSYIHEWARQHPNLSTDTAHPIAWGVIERRGSWAI